PHEDALVAADQLGVGQDAGVGGEAGALGQGDEVPARLGVDEQDPLAGPEGARRGHPSAWRRARARSLMRQKAHTSPGVGDPQTAQGVSSTRSDSASPAKRSWPRSRNEKTKLALAPGDFCSSRLSASL